MLLPWLKAVIAGHVNSGTDGSLTLPPALPARLVLSIAPRTGRGGSLDQLTLCW